MDETQFWLDVRDKLLVLYGDEYGQEDILVAWTIMHDKFFEILEECNK